MTTEGTARYAAVIDHVPPLVREAVALAQRFDFPYTVHPATGRLLSALAGGVGAGVIGETGTGTGAGVAWMLAGASPETRIISIELDEPRATATSELFASHPNVTVLQGEASDLAEHGPFDMLVLDAPTSDGVLHWDTLDPTEHLRANGLLVKDDQWPMTSWPPKTFDGEPDERRIRWLQHPDLFTTEVTVSDGFSVLLGRRRPG